MPTVLQRAPVLAAAIVRSDHPSEPRAAAVSEARAPCAPARVEPGGPILRPIDLERCAFCAH